MKNIGMIVAVEIDAALNEFGVPIEELKLSGYPTAYIPTAVNLVNKAIEIEPTLKRVICASADKFIASKEKKEELHNIYKADICEMEAAGIVLTCNKNEIPCLLIKTVSDSINGGASEFKKSINESAKICIEITRKILNNI